MPPTNEALKFELASLDGSQPSSATLTVTSTPQPSSARTPGQAQLRKGEDRIQAWRCIVREGKERCFGPARPTIKEAVQHMLNKFSERITDVERKRLEDAALAMQLRRCGTDASEARMQGSQPSAAIQTGWQWQRCVAFVHQMYGLFGDDKPMTPLFETSHQKWQAVAKTMHAVYHLWSAAEVESLVKQRYPQFWDMYCNVRYPIMRCDIGRLCILHAFGGLYSDLDVVPNRASYAQVPLAVSRVHEWAHSQEKVAGSQGKRKLSEQGFLEMEVIVGTAGNSVFLDWLEHIQQEIASKPYDCPKSFWHSARMRYVYNTTGPVSMQRFFRLSAKVEGMTFISSTWFKQTKALNLKASDKFDVFSFESNSYFTKEHEIRVPVGPANTPLMQQPVFARMNCKCASRRFCAILAPSKGVLDTGENAAILAPSQGVVDLDEKAEGAPEAPPIASSFEEGGASSSACRAQPSGLDSNTADALQALGRHAHYTRHTASTRVFLEESPPLVRGLIQRDWPGVDKEFVEPSWWRNSA